MPDEPDIHLLDLIVVLLILIGEARIVATTINRETGLFTLNVGSELFVWRRPETPAAPATLPGTAGKSSEPGGVAGGQNANTPPACLYTNIIGGI